MLEVYMEMTSLNKAWDMSYCDYGAWDINTFDRTQSIKCPVPGAVHMGLKDAGIISEPLEGMNMLDCAFVEEKDFWYTTSFDMNADSIGERVILYFDGVDVNADYYLNGKHIGSSDNAFLAHEFDVTSVITAGTNELTVRVNEGLKPVKAKSVNMDYMEFSWNQEEIYRTYIRKPQFCYGWDWAKRLSTCGIYKGVYIKSYKGAYWGNPHITCEYDANEKKADINITADINVIKPGAYKIAYKITTDTRYEAERVVAAGETAYNLAVTIQNPRLWWCNGFGEQYLYNISLDIIDQDGNVLDTRTYDYGIRTLYIEQKPIGTDGDKTFTFILNGENVYAKGGNWVPVDQVIGRITRERYETLIQCAVDMNMNMFRVWGGGFYESDDFFDLCDRYGILVWHDFMFACGYYPDYDEDFVENVRKEADYQVKHKRNRTSFVGWSGNNENYSMYEGHKKHIEKKFPFYGQRIYEEVLASACANLDPQREYRLSSPFGGSDPDDKREGDQHFWYVYQPNTGMQYDFFRISDMKSSFLSEFGVIAPMNLETLVRCCDQDERYPQSKQWLFHSNTGDNFNMVLNKYFGIEEPDKNLSVEQYILMGQAIQAEVIKQAFEKFRSEKYLCSGTLFWMYSDCFPTSGWCFVDYYYNKKPLYYHTKKAFAPIGLYFKGFNPNTDEGMKSYGTGSGSIEVFVLNDRLDIVPLDLRLEIMDLSGNVIDTLCTQTTVPKNASVSVMNIDTSAYMSKHNPEDIVFVCTVFENGIEVAQNRYFAAPYGKLALKKANITCEAVQCDGYTQLSISADAYVWMCHLPGTGFDNNDFDIIPGKTVEVKLYGVNVEDYNFSCLSMNDCIGG